MATLESDDANILDAETINWRLIVYPILAVVVIGVAGFGYYYYQLSQREELETKARAALTSAKTPDALAKVADQFPGTDQATMALLAAADGAFSKRDYPGAVQYYQKAIAQPKADDMLAKAAHIGLASSLEASGKVDDAIQAYLAEGRLGKMNPYAPYAYSTAAGLYAARGDKDNERKILTEAAGLDIDSPLVKDAQFKLKELTTPPITMNVPASATTPPSAPTAPAPEAPAR